MPPLASPTGPPRPVRDTHGFADPPGGGGGGFWPCPRPWPLPPAAKLAAPSARRAGSESVMCWERLHALSPSAATIATVASRKWVSLRVGNGMVGASGRKGEEDARSTSTAAIDARNGIPDLQVTF